MTTYTLNGTDLATFGFIPGRAESGNVALTGCFDFPKRLGATHYEWADENGIEPFTDADDLKWSGRDLTYYAVTFGNRQETDSSLASLYSFINSLEDLAEFITPYGTFNVQIKEIQPTPYRGAIKIAMIMREPVVNITGGIIPATGTASNQIDGVPLIAFGLYFTSATSYYGLPSLKEQHTTRSDAEGYQMTKRQANKIDFRGFIMAESLGEFDANIKALHAAFSAPGTRLITIGGKTTQAFLTEGFKIDSLFASPGLYIAKMNMDITTANV